VPTLGPVYGGTTVPLGKPFYSSREISGDDLEYHMMAELEIAEQFLRNKTRDIHRRWLCTQSEETYGGIWGRRRIVLPRKVTVLGK
jgi:hypothetical protein